MGPEASATLFNFVASDADSPTLDFRTGFPSNFASLAPTSTTRSRPPEQQQLQQQQQQRASVDDTTSRGAGAATTTSLLPGVGSGAACGDAQGSTGQELCAREVFRMKNRNNCFNFSYELGRAARHGFPLTLSCDFCSSGEMPGRMSQLQRLER